MFNAHVTVDRDGYLTPDSTVTVHDATDGTTVAHVPATDTDGNRGIWNRVDQALRQHGWAVTFSLDHHQDCDVVRFTAGRI